MKIEQAKEEGLSSTDFSLWVFDSAGINPHSLECVRLPSSPVHHSIPALPRKVLAVRQAVSLAFLGAALAFSPISFAQTNSQTKKPSETPTTKDSSPPLSHDLSGVWMQYR